MTHSLNQKVSAANDFSSWLRPPFCDLSKVRRSHASIAAVRGAMRTQKNHGSDASVAVMSGEFLVLYRRLLSRGALARNSTRSFKLLSMQ
jgi:hypothetical protein